MVGVATLVGRHVDHHSAGTRRALDPGTRVVAHVALVGLVAEGGRDRGDVLDRVLIGQAKIAAGGLRQTEGLERAGAFGDAPARGRQAARRRPQQAHPSLGGQRASQVAGAEHLVVVMGEQEEVEPRCGRESRHGSPAAADAYVGIAR